MDTGRFEGEFWSRAYVADADVSGQLGRGVLDTPLQCAVSDACMAVEVGDEFASVQIRKLPDGNFSVAAVSTDSSRTATLATVKCDKCGEVTYGDVHPPNGCERSVVKEIMQL